MLIYQSDCARERAPHPVLDLFARIYHAVLRDQEGGAK